jgi:TetR/AcrR family transcriptional regulator, transcriptional repressor for nem operon
MELEEMRYEKGRKEATHQRIIEVGAQEFRKRGIAATGLAGLMEEADLTIGAFYPNFASKAQLVTETLTYVLNLQHAKMSEIIESGGLEAGVRSYLNPEHLANPQDGCPSAALLPEVTRQATDARSAYQDGLLPFIAMLAEQLPEGDSKASKGRAFALFGLLVGTLQIARAIPDVALAESVLKEGIEAAMNLAGESVLRVARPAVKIARKLPKRSNPRK